MDTRPGMMAGDDIRIQYLAEDINGQACLLSTRVIDRYKWQCNDISLAAQLNQQAQHAVPAAK
jgi:hypothetical protein